MSSKDSMRWQPFVPAIIWFLIVLVLMCTPRPNLPDTKLLKIIFLDKAVHFACFFLLVVLFYYPISITGASFYSKLNYLIRLSIAGVVWGITTELIQRYFITGRSFDLFDWLADSLGAIAAFYAVRWWLKNRKPLSKQ
jgi:VanZ family protein